MSTISISDTISNNIVAFDASDYSWYEMPTNLSNGFNGSSNTTYTQVRLATGSRTASYVYWIFDSFSSIPESATITSVSCSCKCYINTTSSYYVTTRQAQLYSGTTAKGTAYTISASTTAFSITAGTWTREDLQNARLRIYVVRGSRNTSSNYYFRFYGATLTVNYSYNGVGYTITSSSRARGITVSPASQDIPVGDSGSVLITGTLVDETVTDNGTDVTNQLISVESISAAAYTQINTNNFNSTYASRWVNYAVGRTAENPYGVPNTTNLRSATSSNQYVDYYFNLLSIPSEATISSVTVKVYGHRSDATVDSTHVASVQLMSGSTNKGTAQELSTTTNSINTISDPGTWTATELKSAVLRFTVGQSGGGCLGGITWGVSYNYGGYLYTITNISADHTVLVTGTSAFLPIKVKSNGTWVEPQKIYAKSGGTWHLAQSIYVNVGGGWIPNSVDPTGHSIWVDDYPWDESNPNNPYNNDWASSFYESYSMGEYLDQYQRNHPTGTKYNYVGPMEFNGKTIFLWQVAPDSPDMPDPSTIKYAATTTNDINLLRSMSVCNYTTSEDLIAAISPGGSALNKIMLLSSDIGTYENFSDNLGGEVLFKVE